mmetsp:Transcript_18724/g.45027  ORF Transcript_18724/g.45027 Transcript_18724/m.45027 type:complete len:371 (+) Transcript_18724:126-1238(+)
MPPKLALLEFKFEDFEGLPSERGQSTWSEELTDPHGNAWKLLLYPCGDRREDEGWVSIYLCNSGENDVCAKYSFIMRNASGEVHTESNREKATKLFKAGGDGRGRGKWIKRSEILDEKNNILSDGALVLDVHLQVIERGSLHKPSGSVLTKMLQLLENTDNADVYFKVGDEVVTSHKLIRSMNAPVLFEFCGENNDGSPVAIDDTSAEIFRIILRYVYGEEIPESKTIMDEGKDIISAADRFGIVGLKLAVEAVLVESSVVRSHTVADWLVFADSKTCPLLKEQATAYFASRSADILKCESSKLLKESPKLLTELLIEASKSSNESHFSGGNASVDEMRKKLHARGLGVDGSKETLISRLQESNKRQRTE